MIAPRLLSAALCVMPLLGWASDEIREPVPWNDAPLAREAPPSHGGPAVGWRNAVVPALETGVFHFWLLAFSTVVTKQDFALLSADAIASHFDGRRPWQFDTDYFITNQFGHPYQGAFAFTAARSSGLPFWAAALYPLLASLTWELFFEVEPPSINDQITTSIGGIFLGEVLHRAAELVLHGAENGEAPSWGRRISAFLLSPMDTTNQWLFAGQMGSGDASDHPPHFAQLSGGANIGSVLRDPITQEPHLTTGTQLVFEARLTYGIPGDPSFRYTHPFSHFDIEVSFSSLGGPVTGTYFSRGLLWGQNLADAKSPLRGVWGVFGQYDYSGASLMRVSSVGLGLGTSLQWRVSQKVFIQASGVLSAVPFSTAGSLGLDEDLYRDYHIGPGAQAVIELRFIQRNVGWLRLVGRNWFTVGAYTPIPGWESITYVTLGPMARIFGPIAIGADVILMLRRPHFDDDTFEHRITGFTTRVTVSWLSDWQFGVVERSVRW